MSGSPASSAPNWTTHKAPDGRTYWSHTTTKQSVWEKPDELRTPFENALKKTVWKQYVSRDRPYYVNSETKETKWELPQELLDLKARVDREEERKARRERGEASPSRSPSPERGGGTPRRKAIRGVRSPNGADGASPMPSAPVREPLPHLPGIPSTAPQMPPQGFHTFALAEGAFLYLLHREGFDEQSTWDEVMRRTVTDPLFRALDTLSEQRAAFEKYQSMIRDARIADREARIAKLRPLLMRLFSLTNGVEGWWGIKTAEKVFAHDRAWREARREERRLIFEEFIKGVRDREESNERALRQRNLAALGALVRTLDITVFTRWRAAHDLILSSPAFKADKELQAIETLDILSVYDDYARQLEAEFEASSRRYKVDSARSNRKARDSFRALLHDLQEQGKLHRRSRWMDTHRLIRHDKRYEDLLGVPGSSPLDLWMDVVDDLADEVERAAEKLERAFEKLEPAKKMQLGTKTEEYEEWVKKSGMEVISEALITEAYDLIMERLEQTQADERRREERRRRHRVEDLRYAMKKVQRHLDVDMTYEEAVPHLKDLPEWKDVDNDEDRRSAFEKYIKRQKEKMREMEDDADSTRGGGSSRRDGDRERERDRDSRRVSDRMDLDDLPRERERNGDRGDRRDRDKERDRRYERDDRDAGRHWDRERDREGKEAKEYDREREKRRESWKAQTRRNDTDRGGRSERDGRDAERVKERSRDDDRDKDRRRESRAEDEDDRQYKRRRMSIAGTAPKPKDEEPEEGEI